jgi:hypothetical protein
LEIFKKGTSVYMHLLQDFNREGREKTTTATAAATVTGTHLDAHLDATPIHIEKMVKLFKTHWCPMDFDTNFCKAAFIKEKDA